MIGDPNATSVASGSITSTNLTITAQRTDASRIISDAAGAAIAFAKTSGGGSGAYGASFAGGFAFNTIEGGITSGVYNISDLSVSGSTTILSQALTAGKQGTALGNIYSFAGGFAVSANIGSANTSTAAGAALGLAITKNTINDSLKAQISNISGRAVSGLAGGATKQIQLGALSVSAKNMRLINAEATGDSLTLSTGGNTAPAVAVAIGAAQSTNTINSDVSAIVDLGSSVELLLGGALDLTSLDLSKISVFALAVGLTMAKDSSGISLSGGGSGATNTITSLVSSLLRSASYRNTASDTSDKKATKVSASTNTTNSDGSTAQQREIKATTAAGSVAVAKGMSGTSVGASIGATVIKNQIQANSSGSASANLLQANLTANNVVTSGSISISTSLSQNIDATAAAASLAIAVSAQDASLATVALSGAGASATNTIVGTSNASLQTLSAAGSTGTLLQVAGNISLSTEASDQIKANVGSGSLAISYAGTNSPASIAPSIGVSIASNTISGDATTLISGFLN